MRKRLASPRILPLRLHRSISRSPDTDAARVVLPLLILLVLVAGSCDNGSPTQPPQTKTETYLIRDVDYVKGTYFMIDHAAGLQGATESSFEVYRQVLPMDLFEDPSINWFWALAVPDPANDGQALVDAVAEIAAGQSPREVMRGWFVRLEAGVDYTELKRDGVVVGVELSQPVPPEVLKTLAVRYQTPSGTAIGGSYSSYGFSAPKDTLVLEMIKAPIPDPFGNFPSTWSLEVRNIYDLGVRNIEPGSYKIQIEDVLAARTNPTVPLGGTVSYRRIFGLDATDDTGTGPPDGRIDADRLDLERGLLNFPDPHAFAPDPANVAKWTDGQFAFTGVYEAQYDSSRAIYNRRLLGGSVDEAHAHQYLIRFTHTVPK